jgi:hypothetical protein
MEGGIRLNWEVIFAEARKRRKEWGLTQEHLVAIAKAVRRMSRTSGRPQSAKARIRCRSTSR